MLRVAVGLPTAVVLWPVLPSWVMSGKNLLTTLSGTTTLRGSVEPDDEESPYAASESAPIAASTSAASQPSGDLHPISTTPLLQSFSHVRHTSAADAG